MFLDVEASFGAEDAYLRHAERVWAAASFTASRLAALACKRLLRPFGLKTSGFTALAGGIHSIVTDGDYQPLRGWVVGKHTAHQTIPLRSISLMLNIRQRLRRCSFVLLHLQRANPQTTITQGVALGYGLALGLQPASKLFPEFGKIKRLRR